MKRLSVSPAVRQLRVTTATSYHIIPVTVSMIRNEGWGGRQKGARAHGWLECIVRQPLQKNSMEISHKIQKELLWIQLCCFWVCIWEGSLLSISERYLYSRIIAGLATVPKAWRKRVHAQMKREEMAQSVNSLSWKYEGLSSINFV